jgi:hypothetical protein
MIYPDAPLRRSRWMITGRNARGLFEWVPTRVKCLPYPYSECSFPQGKFFRDRRISGGACKRTKEAVALAAPRVGCESRGIKKWNRPLTSRQSVKVLISQILLGRLVFLSEACDLVFDVASQGKSFLRRSTLQFC